MHVRFHDLAILTLFASAAAAGAQEPGTRIPYVTSVAINPLAIPFDIVSGEIETGIAQGVTIGALASYTRLDDDRYTTFDAKFRYYPGEVVLRGFSLGASVGYTHFVTTSTPQRQELDFPTLGIILDYNWLIGRHERFLVGAGVGAKRVLASSDDRDRVALDHAYVTARFVIGFTF